MKKNQAMNLLESCVARIVELEDKYADDVLLDIGFTPEQLKSEFGYEVATYSIDELPDRDAVAKALIDTREADFPEEAVSVETLMDYNRMTKARYTYGGTFVRYGEE